MAKYIFGILACAFLALGFTHISNKELQGFQKETGVPAIDMSYNEEQIAVSLLPALINHVKKLIRC